MPVINHTKREINVKLVYYGPAGSGKASLFRYIHQRIKPSLCGPLRSMPAGGDELLFFDYLPFEHADQDGYQIRFHLYTLTGPVGNPGAWKMVLKGADGLAVVAEAGAEHDPIVLQAVRALQSILAGHTRDLRQLPCVLVSNKVDLAAADRSGWGAELSGIPLLGSSAVTGEGILQTLATLTQAVVQQVREGQKQAPVTDRADEAPATDKAAEAPLSDLQTPVPDQQVPNTPPAIVVPDATTSLSLPVTLQVDGVSRHFALRIAIKLEEVSGGVFSV